MIKEIRRLLAHKSIKKYLRYFLPQIGLGDLVSFRCHRFYIGDYIIRTSNETYHLTFWEYVSSGKEFHITLNDDNETLETIVFSISYFFGFHIYAKSLTFITSEGTYVTSLINEGYTIFYPNEDDISQYFELNKLKKLPKYVDLHRLLKVSRDEWL